MKILAIKLNNKRNTNIFNVKTDESEYVLHSDIIVKHSLSLGDVDEKIFSLAVNESNTLIATEKAMKYLSSKLKTEQQLKDYLYKQGYHKQTVNAVIEKLKDYGLIDDSKFAKSYVRSNPNFSKNKLKQKLISFGVKQNILDDILCDIDDGETCLKDASKFMKNKELDTKTKEKLTRHLVSKGYGYDTIKSVFNKLNFDEF